MARHTIPVEDYLDLLERFPWATIDDFALWFPNHVRRSRKVLKRLAERRVIRAVRYRGKIAYALKRKSRGITDEYSGLRKIHHGLQCTRCLVRLGLAKSVKMENIIAESEFYGLGCIPEFGIKYDSGNMLLLEFCTKDNYKHSGLMRGKISAYRRHLLKIEKKFGARAFVVFVIDIDRDTVARFVDYLASTALGREAGSLRFAPAEGDRFPLDPFYFVDYETFMKVEIGCHIEAEIYYFMDGKVYNLK